MSIETRHFIATGTDIAKVAAQAIDGDIRANNARGVFFKSLIATTQHELGSPPRQRNVSTEKLSADEVKAHLAAFEKVAKRFCTAVQEVAAQTVPDGTAEELRSRTRFAFSAASTVRGFIRAGGDIRGIAAHKAVKRALATPRTKRKLNADALKRRATTLGTELEKIARSMAPELAREALTPLLVKLGALAGKAGAMTKDPAEAMREHAPLRTKAGVFFPIDRSALQ